MQYHPHRKGSCGSSRQMAPGTSCEYELETKFCNTCSLPVSKGLPVNRQIMQSEVRLLVPACHHTCSNYDSTHKHSSKLLLMDLIVVMSLQQCVSVRIAKTAFR